MPEIERDGEELPRMSPGVGCDSTAQGNSSHGPSLARIEGASNVCHVNLVLHL